MRRSNKDRKSEIIPSESMCVKFVGQLLPKYVFLFYIKHAVSVFVPKVRICYNCYKAGHMNFYILSTYIVIGKDSPRDLLQDMFNSFGQKARFIFMGDLNAHGVELQIC